MIKKVLHNSNTLNKCQCVGILNQNSVWNAKHTMSSLFLECCWMSSDAYPYWTPAINDHHGFVWVLERAGTRPAPLRQLANWMAWFHSLKTWGATQWPSRRPTRLEIHMLKHSNISKIKTCPLFMWTCVVVMSEAQIEVWSVLNTLSKLNIFLGIFASKGHNSTRELLPFGSMHWDMSCNYIQRSYRNCDGKTSSFPQIHPVPHVMLVKQKMRSRTSLPKPPGCSDKISEKKHGNTEVIRKNHGTSN